MRLIDKIEINYFRSVHGANLKKVGDLNIFVGGNDSGKSNFLRALNLFFNNQTDYHEDIEFLLDANHSREIEARKAKGRLTIWMKIHFNNVLNWSALPNKFWIKKVWNRYYDEPEISSNIKTQKTQTRFLNKIAFHYVPAVKERDIFNVYLVTLYETLANQSGVEFSKPAQTLTNAINQETSGLSQNIQNTLGVESKIQVPNNLEAIFGGLEFSTLQNSIKVPLKNRGDGLQVRHIPHILQYISNKNKKLNIWGYEEPENSLELSNCFALAEEFVTQFSKNNQIFITSHSPAFYGIEGQNTKHYSVKKSPRTIFAEGEKFVNDVSLVSLIDDMSVIDEELGVAQLIMTKSAEAYEEIALLRRTNISLRNLSKPVLLTEGKTDVVILKAAWEKVRNYEIPFEIQSCDLGGNNQRGAAGAGQLQKVLDATTKDERVIRIGLFDNDDEGKKCFDNLKRHILTDLVHSIKINENRKSAALLLPSFDWSDSYFYYSDRGIVIEMLFDRVLFSKSDVSCSFAIKSGNISKEKADTIISQVGKETANDLMNVRYIFNNKNQLAETIGSFDQESFYRFDTLFTRIESIINELLTS